MSRDKRNVVVTGFGPFGVHSVNNSWECVKLIKSSDFEERNDVRLIIKEIPVIYDSANEIVPQLWNRYDPILVVHVGVHSGGDNIIIEKRAHSHGYVRNDVKNCLPPDGKCPAGLEEVLDTQFDVDSIRSDDVRCSTDAGRFLCEYTYYLSLSKDRTRSLFVHIPPCNSCVPTDTIVQNLCEIIENCLRLILKSWQLKLWWNFIFPQIISFVNCASSMQGRFGIVIQKVGLKLNGYL